MPKVCSAPEGCDRETIARNLCQKHYKQWLRKGARVQAPPTLSGGDEYDAAWLKFCEFIGTRRRREAQAVPEPLTSRTRYGAVSDLHVPFHDEGAVMEAIEHLRSQGVTRLVVGGDFLDCYSLSRFTQYESIPIRSEFVAARVLLDYFSRTFSKVTVIEGNHEAREKKYLAAKLPPDLLDWFLDASIMQRLSRDMPNVEIVTRTVANTSVAWLAQMGRDCIVGHPEVSSRVLLKPVDTFRQWLNEWHETIGLARPRLVIIGHTHQAGMAWAGQTLLVENGCLCLNQGYALQPNLYPKPQRLACTMFDQIDGVTDPNSVHQFFPRCALSRAA